MARKDDLKLLFNFMIELLKDEQETNTVKEDTKFIVPNITPREFNEINKEILSEKYDDSAKHILEVMKRAELMGKMRSTVIGRPKVVPPSLRDDDEIAQNDREVINTHKTEKKDKNIKIKEAENKKFYLPVGKYKITVSKDKVTEIKSFEVTAPKK